MDNKFISLTMIDPSKESPSLTKKSHGNKESLYSRSKPSHFLEKKSHYFLGVNDFVINMNDQLDEFVIILKSIQNGLKTQGRRCDKIKLLKDISMIFKIQNVSFRKKWIFDEIRISRSPDYPLR